MSGLNSLLKTLYDIGAEGTYHVLRMNPPPFVTNGFMVTSKYVPWERHTVDGLIKKIAGYLGKEIEGPIFGSHKTIEGLALGIGAGAVTGYLMTVIPQISNHFEPQYFWYGLGASVLAAFGDLTGSFIKRRHGKKEGTDAPILDSLTWMMYYPTLYTVLNNPNPSAAASLGLTYFVGYLGHRISNRLGDDVGITKTIRE